MFFNQKLERTNLTNTFEGASVFLFGGGRSISPRHIEMAKKPGILTASLNEAGHFIRPNIYLLLSPASSTHATLRDPTIMKFVPIHIRKKMMWEDKEVDKRYMDYPNVHIFKFKYYRNTNWFLDENHIYFQKPFDSKMNSSALILLNILIKLGFKKIYLVGLDFYTRTNPDTYFYDKKIYEIANVHKIKRIINTFEEISKLNLGVELYNTNKKSPLNDFLPYKNFGEAIKENEIFYDEDINKINTRERFKWSCEQIKRYRHKVNEV